MPVSLCLNALRPSQQFLSCQHGATASWITSTFRGANVSLLKDTTRRVVGIEPRPLVFESETVPQGHRAASCGTKGHYILPLSDLSKTVIVMTMIHGIVQVLVSLWFYYLTRPSRKRFRVKKTLLHPTCIK